MESSSSTHDEVWNRFKRFYTKNEKMLEKCISTDVKTIARGEKSSEIEQQIDSFQETTKVVLDGLAELGKIHPIIGAAVVAFHAVISLDLARRRNDKKVVTIMVEMQSMMCAMFQLRHLSHAHVNAIERAQEKMHLDTLVNTITSDITKCGSDINYYLSQKFVFKMAKAWLFEERFKSHVQQFAKRRSELQMSIAAYSASGVDHANLTVSLLSTKVDALDDKIDDAFKKLFHKLDTQSERDTREFLKINGGIDKCVARDDLLVKLLALTGDVVPQGEGGEAGENNLNVTKSRQMIQDELQKNFEESLTQNAQRFEKLLAVQNNNHERVIAHLEKQEGYQMVAMSKLDELLFYMHPEMKLNDPELSRIWDGMGLKTSSVKAQKFVLTFRDHYYNLAKSVGPSPVTNGQPGATQMDPATGGSQDSTELTPAGSGASLEEEDPHAWLLDFIDVAHVRPVVEALDADGSGFLSVKEINTFARSKPTDWSFLQWMVFWAAGWHVNMVSYREKIYDILVEMHELAPLIHPANQRDVGSYLDSYDIRTIEAILRCTQDAGVDKQSSQLKELAASYAEIQEAALKMNLQEISYVMSSPADAVLVGGAGRPESWLYPLLSLLLERHLAVMKLAKTRVLNKNEMITHQFSLYYALAVFRQRKDTLQAMFSQMYQNIDGNFKTFAYGMFYAIHKADIEIRPVKTTLFEARSRKSRQQVILESSTKSAKDDAPLDLSVLALEPAQPFEFNFYDSQQPKSVSYDSPPHPIGGHWCGVCFFDEDEVLSRLGQIQFALSVTSDGTLSGVGQSYRGDIKLSGRVLEDSLTDVHQVTLDMTSSDTFSISLKGVYHAERDVLDGKWELLIVRPPTPPTDAQTPPANPADGAENLERRSASPKFDQQVDAGEDESSAHTDDDSPSASGHTGRLSPTRKDESTAEDDGQHLADQQLPDAAGAVLETGDTNSTGSSETSHAPIHSQQQQETTSEVQYVPGESGRFSLTRTPPTCYRFRVHLNPNTHASLSSARRRWIFAIEATLCQVRSHTFSWENVCRKIAERRQWVSLSLKFDKSLITPGDVDVFFQMLKDWNPEDARYYETLAQYLGQRNWAYIVSNQQPECDNCGNPVIVSRFRCITCIREDLSNEVDLCADDLDCLLSSPTNTKDNFAHSPSHSLLRQTYLVHDCELPALIALCRARSDDVKRKYRLLEEQNKATKSSRKSSRAAKTVGVAQKEVPLAEEPIICVCCGEAIKSLPCWICATCAIETPICLNCERTRATVQLAPDGVSSERHSHNHLLLRIHDNKEILPREINNARLQQELSVITSDLRVLERKVTSHLRSASQVTAVLKALAEAIPNVKLEALIAGDSLRPDDLISEIFSDIGTTTDGHTSAPLSPNPASPSALPATSDITNEAGDTNIPAQTQIEHEHGIGLGALRVEENLIMGVNINVDEGESTVGIVSDSPTQVNPDLLGPHSLPSTDFALPATSPPEDGTHSLEHQSKLSPNSGIDKPKKSEVLARLDSLDERMSTMEQAVNLRFSSLENQILEVLSLLKKIS